MLAVFAATVLLRGIDVPPFIQRYPQLLVAAAGTLWAATSFDRGDPPRRGWLLFAIAASLAFTVGPAITTDARVLGLPLGPSIIVVGNLLFIAAILRLFFNLRASGLAPPWNAAWKIAAPIALVASIGVGATVVLTGKAPDTAVGTDVHVWLVRRIAGYTADIIVFNAALQMLRITFPMRRGMIALPYLLLALMASMYMAVGTGLAVSATGLQVDLGWLGRALDTTAWTCMGLAGGAQALAVRHARRPAAGEPAPEA